MLKAFKGTCPKFNTVKQITIEYHQPQINGIKGNVKGCYVKNNFTCNEECNVTQCPIYEQAPNTF